MKRLQRFILVLVLFVSVMLIVSFKQITDNNEIREPLIINGIDVNEKEGLTYLDTTQNFGVTDEYVYTDVYTDSNDALYYYVKKTDLFLGFYRQDYSTSSYDENNHLAKDDIIEIADQFIKVVMGEKSSYELTFCEYVERRKFYDINYYYTINGIKTDDRLSVRISSDGEILAFTAKNRDRYKDVNFDRILKQIEESKKSSNLSQYSINKEYVTKNEKGELVYRYEVSTSTFPELFEIPVG